MRRKAPSAAAAVPNANAIVRPREYCLACIARICGIGISVYSPSIKPTIESPISLGASIANMLGSLALLTQTTEGWRVAMNSRGCDTGCIDVQAVMRITITRAIALRKNTVFIISLLTVWQVATMPFRHTDGRPVNTRPVPETQVRD